MPFDSRAMTASALDGPMPMRAHPSAHPRIANATFLWQSIHARNDTIEPVGPLGANWPARLGIFAWSLDGLGETSTQRWSLLVDVSPNPSTLLALPVCAHIQSNTPHCSKVQQEFSTFAHFKRLSSRPQN